ncbi:uncharacterized protein PG986_007621 [Apiospora aurea]|uniref:Aminoglycoside phosphotransferase domain-containing protein n=1 Tax=Apiospora aurea TaxID=335848 RepID=A0ABR1QD35_9PEZI
MYHQIVRDRANVNWYPGQPPIDLDGSYPLLGDHSRSGTAKVDARFVGTHARLAPSLRWLDVAKHASSNKRTGTTPSATLTDQQTTDRHVDQSRGSSSMGAFSSICLATWRMAPSKLRIAIYILLPKVGRRIYGHSGSSLVQILPFGLYLKCLGDPDALHNEFNALEMVRKYSSVPVPRPLDIVSSPNESKDRPYSADMYVLTTRIPGVPLSDCQEMLSDEDSAEFVVQMQGYLTQLRAIPKTVGPEYAICNTLGGPRRDSRIQDGNPVGPFVDEASFSQLLRNSNDPGRRGHNTVFTHADLKARNMVKLSGIQENITRYGIHLPPHFPQGQ